MHDAIPVENGLKQGDADYANLGKSVNIIYMNKKGLLDDGK